MFQKSGRPGPSRQEVDEEIGKQVQDQVLAAGKVAIVLVSIDDTISIVRKHVDQRGWTNTFKSGPATAAGVPLRPRRSGRANELRD